MDLYEYCKGNISADVLEKYDLTISYKSGYTPLHNLCRNSSITAKMIEKYDLTIVDEDNYTPLHYLCKNINVTAEMIEKYNLSIGYNKLYHTPLYLLCYNNSVNIKMIDKYDLTIADCDNYVPLRVLCNNCKIIPEIFYKYDVSPYFAELFEEKYNIAIYTLTLPYNLNIGGECSIDLHRDYKNYCCGIYRRDKFHLAHPRIRDITAIMIHMRLPSYIAIHIGVLSFSY